MPFCHSLHCPCNEFVQFSLCKNSHFPSTINVMPPSTFYSLLLSCPVYFAQNQTKSIQRFTQLINYVDVLDISTDRRAREIADLIFDLKKILQNICIFTQHFQMELEDSQNMSIYSLIALDI